MDIARMIDQSLLKPDVIRSQVEQLCVQGREFNFISIVVNPVWVRHCKDLLGGTTVRVCTVSGFPLGASKPEVKAKEAEVAVKDGADEIDMVMNVGAFKTGDLMLVEMEIEEVRAAIGKETTLKVIIEAGLLTDEEKIKAAGIIKACGGDFVKTNTGFGYGGATVEDVKLLRQVVGADFGIKASGGIRDYATALSLIKAGANRIGTSSGVRIIEESLSAEK